MRRERVALGCAAVLVVGVLGVVSVLEEWWSRDWSREPTVVEDPVLVWEDGVAPSSALESNEWVQALREYELGWSMAWNMGDFTLPQLTDHVERWEVVDLAEDYAKQEAPLVALGPFPFEPLSVHELDSGGVAVLVCAPEDLGLMWLSASGERTMGEPRAEREARVRVRFLERDELTGDVLYLGGSRNVPLPEEVRSRSVETCDGSGISVGYFAEQPEVPEHPVKVQREPLPEDS